MYIKVFSHQTTTDISPGRNMPHIMGELVIFVPKITKYPFLTKQILLRFFNNIFIIFTQLL